MPVRATKRGAERTPLSGDADVLICGASFAGLAVARELAALGRARGDRRPLRGRRAADLGVRGADRVAAEPRPRGARSGRRSRGSSSTRPRATTTWPLPWTFSTFDYRTLCGLLFEQARRRVRDREGRTGAPEATSSTPTAATCARRSSSTRSAGAGCWARATNVQPPEAFLVARPGGAPRRRERRPRAVARPEVRPRGLLVVVPGRRRGARRRRLVRPAPPRQGPDARARRATSASTRCASRATGSRTSCARRPTTACSSPATAPGTACRSPPRASAPRSTSAWPAGASCAPSSTASKHARGGAARLRRVQRRARPRVPVAQARAEPRGRG